MRSRTSSTYGSSSKAITCYSKEKTVKHSWLSEEEIKNALLQAFKDVENQLKRDPKPITVISEFKLA